MACSQAVEESAISVTLEDGSEVQYSMRGLKNEEVKPWAEFCASVFAYKTNPPPASYFERHFYNDPNRDASLIRVVMYQGKIVSSCRIFQRRVAFIGRDGDAFSGGIGEVCTDANHRKRGLSKLLLQDAIQIMKKRGMGLSLLHAAPAFFPVYQKGGGYECVTSRWSVVSVIQSNLQDPDNPYMIRLAQFPQDTKRMQAIHQRSSEGRFVGCIVRTEQYWNDYISKELDGSLWTITKNDKVVAWASLRLKGGRYQMRDFGCDKDSISVADALSMLLKVALQHVEEERVSLHLPTAVLEDAKQDSATILDWSTVVSENDDGWMYKTLQQGQTSMIEAAKTRDHLIWPADSF